MLLAVVERAVDRLWCLSGHLHLRIDSMDLLLTNRVVEEKLGIHLIARLGRGVRVVVGGKHPAHSDIFISLGPLRRFTRIGGKVHGVFEFQLVLLVDIALER